MTKPSIILAGHVCIDHNESDGITYTNWGSAVMYIASYLRNAYEVDPLISTTYGPDFLKYSKGYDLLPKQPVADMTLLYRNIIRGKQRSWFCEHPEVAVPPPITDELKTALRSADILMFGMLLPNYPTSYIREMLSYVSRDCLTTIVAQGYLRTIGSDNKVTPRDFIEAPEMISSIDLTVLSEDDHLDINALAVEWKGLPEARDIIVTQGERGASFATERGLQNIATTTVAPEDIVDSVGCGDVFAAALTYDYYHSRDLEHAIKAANEAARAKLLYSGVVGG